MEISSVRGTCQADAVSSRFSIPWFPVGCPRWRSTHSLDSCLELRLYISWPRYLSQAGGRPRNDSVARSMENTYVPCDSWANLGSTCRQYGLLDKLFECDYGRDELLRLCDIRNKHQFARHAICTILHNDGIKALPGQKEEDDGEISIHIKGHLAALRSSTNYLQAFRAVSHDKTWIVLHTSFDHSLDHKSVQRTHQY